MRGSDVLRVQSVLKVFQALVFTRPELAVAFIFTSTAVGTIGATLHCVNVPERSHRKPYLIWKFFIHGVVKNSR